MPTTPLTATPYPAYGIIPDVPADLLAALSHLEKYTNMRFASAAARDTALPVPVAGMQAYVTGTGLTYYDGDSWELVIPELPPLFFGSQGTVQTIATGTTTFTPITLQDETLDTGNQHSTASLTSRVNIGTKLGWYEVSGSVAFGNASAVPATSDTRRAGILLNGATSPLPPTQIIHPYPKADAGLVSVTIPPLLVQATASGDYIELGAAHNASGTISTVVSGGYRSWLKVEWKRP